MRKIQTTCHNRCYFTGWDENVLRNHDILVPFIRLFSLTPYLSYMVAWSRSLPSQHTHMGPKWEVAGLKFGAHFRNPAGAQLILSSVSMVFPVCLPRWVNDGPWMSPNQAQPTKTCVGPRWTEAGLILGTQLSLSSVSMVDPTVFPQMGPRWASC